MPPKTRYHLTIEEKKRILAICDEQRKLPGKQSFRSLVQTVALQTGRTLSPRTINKILDKRAEIESIIDVKNQVRIKPDIEIKFESLLAEKLLTIYKCANIYYEIGVAVALEIQTQEQFQSTVMANYIFCRPWWAKFCHRHGYRYGRTRGTMKAVPIAEIEAERKALRTDFVSYSNCNIGNVDQSRVWQFSTLFGAYIL